MMKNAGRPKHNNLSSGVFTGTCLLFVLLLLVVAHPNNNVLLDAPLTGLYLGEGQTAAARSDVEPDRSRGKVFSAYFSKLARERRAIDAPRRTRASPSRAVENLSPADLFIAVKTTRQYHRLRLDLLLETWMSRSLQQVLNVMKFCHVMKA